MIFVKSLLLLTLSLIAAATIWPEKNLHYNPSVFQLHSDEHMFPIVLDEAL